MTFEMLDAIRLRYRAPTVPDHLTHHLRIRWEPGQLEAHGCLRRELVVLADCRACHTTRGGADFSGRNAAHDATETTAKGDRQQHLH
jgi:hypothetical protein